MRGWWRCRCGCNLPGGPLYGKFPGKNVVIPLCGAIDTTTLGRVIDRGLAADSRLIRFGVNERPPWWGR